MYLGKISWGEYLLRWVLSVFSAVLSFIIINLGASLASLALFLLKSVLSKSLVDVRTFIDAAFAFSFILTISTVIHESGHCLEIAAQGNKMPWWCFSGKGIFLSAASYCFDEQQVFYGSAFARREALLYLAGPTFEILSVLLIFLYNKLFGGVYWFWWAFCLFLLFEVVKSFFFIKSGNGDRIAYDEYVKQLPILSQFLFFIYRSSLLIVSFCLLFLCAYCLVISLNPALSEIVINRLATALSMFRAFLFSFS